MNKKELSESDICAMYITPAVIQSGGDETYHNFADVLRELRPDLDVVRFEDSQR